MLQENLFNRTWPLTVFASQKAVDFLLYTNIITLRAAFSGIFPEEKHLLLSQESVSRKHNPAALKWQTMPGSPQLTLSASAQI